MDWFRIQNLIDEQFPDCIRIILSVCGYDTIASLKYINIDSVLEIQRQMNLYFRGTIQELNCCHSDYYKQQNEFELLPGHRDLILSIPKCIESANSNKQAYEENGSLSTVMKSMLKSALQNSERDKNHSQYDDIIRFFSTYVFLLSGRSCYEILNHNLPIPSTKTVCEYKINQHFM